MTAVSLRVNGSPVTVEVGDSELLLDTLRSVGLLSVREWQGSALAFTQLTHAHLFDRAHVAHCSTLPSLDSSLA